jgi:hypothetical protein
MEGTQTRRQQKKVCMVYKDRTGTAGKTLMAATCIEGKGLQCRIGIERHKKVRWGIQV